MSYFTLCKQSACFQFKDWPRNPKPGKTLTIAGQFRRIKITSWWKFSYCSCQFSFMTTELSNSITTMWFVIPIYRGTFLSVTTTNGLIKPKAELIPEKTSIEGLLAWLPLAFCSSCSDLKRGTLVQPGMSADRRAGNAAIAGAAAAASPDWCSTAAAATASTGHGKGLQWNPGIVWNFSDPVTCFSEPQPPPMREGISRPSQENNRRTCIIQRLHNESS